VLGIDKNAAAGGEDAHPKKRKKSAGIRMIIHALPRDEGIKGCIVSLEDAE
jgi:hypothetical protein